MDCLIKINNIIYLLRKNQKHIKYKSLFSWELHRPIDWKLEEGIEIHPKDITVCTDKTFEYKGHKVLVYIRDNFRYNENKKKQLPRFHLSECRTIIDMKEKKRYTSRYVVTNKKDGFFKIRFNNLNLEEKKLPVCKNCLENLNYKNYRSIFKYFHKSSVLKNFSIKEFFKAYRGIQDIPAYTEETAPENKYHEKQSEINRRYKDSVDWKCESCDKSFINDKRNLHVHHIDGHRANNSKSNLKALCKNCHAQEPYHDHMKRRI